MPITRRMLAISSIVLALILAVVIFLLVLPATQSSTPGADAAPAKWPESICGNGITELGEQCDDGKNGNNSDICYDNCTFTYCGDAYAQRPNGKDTEGERGGFAEECDDGADNGKPNRCNVDCLGITPAVCGNSIVEAGEQCEDGNSYNNDSCLSNCTNATCGDSYVLPSTEECDDGNNDTYDGCNNECRIAQVTVVFVLDVSGSTTAPFGGYSVGDVEKAILVNMIRDMNEDVFFGIVAFHSDAFEIVSISKSHNRNDVINLISRVQYSGNTNIIAGLLKAKEMLNLLGGTSYVVLLSDGQMNTGGTVRDLLTQATFMAYRGVKIYAVGVGNTTNELLMKAIAEVSNGQYFEPTDTYAYRELDFIFKQN